VPLDTVVEFKRGVYQLALAELEPFLNADRLRHPALGRRGRRPPQRAIKSEEVGHVAATAPIEEGGT
jgi:hypothetical protein